MKNKLIILPLVLLVMNFASAQTSKIEYKIAHPETTVDPESKALKNFKRTHPNVTGEKWSTDNGYYFVTFKEDGIKNKVVYTRDGQTDYALKMYKENDIPASIRKAVKSIYYDYTIADAQELEVKNKTIYLVKINNANTWKTIRVSNGDLEEIENYYSLLQ